MLIERTAGHAKQFTVSGLVRDEEDRRLLLVHHRKLGFWLPPGGHIEPDETPQAAVLREVLEETGVRARLVSGIGMDLGCDGVTQEQLAVPLTMGYQLIPARPGEPEHIHMDFEFLLAADSAAPLEAEPAEVSEVGWFTLEAIRGLDTTGPVRAQAAHVLRG